MKKRPKRVTRKQRSSSIWSCLLPTARSVFNFPSSLTEFELGNALRDETRRTLAERVVNVPIWGQAESAVVFFAARSGPQGFVGVELHIGSVCWRVELMSSIINPGLIDRCPGNDGVPRVPLWSPVERASGDSTFCLEDLPVGKDDINSFRLITRAE